jgi:hypothetical protein
VSDVADRAAALLRSYLFERLARFKREDDPANLFRGNRNAAAAR